MISSLYNYTKYRATRQTSGRVEIPPPWEMGPQYNISLVSRSLHPNQNVDPLSRFCTSRVRDRLTVTGIVDRNNPRLILVSDRCHAVCMAGCGHSKIARVRAYYLYCMCLAVLTSVDFDRNENLTVTKY